MSLNFEEGKVEPSRTPNVSVIANALRIDRNRGRLTDRLQATGHHMNVLDIVDNDNPQAILGELRDLMRDVFGRKATMGISIAAQDGAGDYDELAPLKNASSPEINASSLKSYLKLDPRFATLAGTSATFPGEDGQVAEVFLSPDGRDYMFQGNDAGLVVVKPFDPESQELSICLQGAVFKSNNLKGPRLVLQVEGEITPAGITKLGRLVGIEGPMVSRLVMVADDVRTQAIGSFPSSPIEVERDALIPYLKSNHIFANSGPSDSSVVHSVGLSDHSPYTANGHFHGAVFDMNGTVVSGGHFNGASGKGYVAIDPLPAIFRLKF